jgi:hypothetical protein
MTQFRSVIFIVVPFLLGLLKFRTHLLGNYELVTILLPAVRLAKAILACVITNCWPKSSDP